MSDLLSLFVHHDASLAELPFLKVIESYTRYYAEGSGHTARAKRLDLAKFSTFLATFRGFSTPAKLTVQDWDNSAVQRFIDDSLGGGESPATVARRLATIKHMGRTLSERVPGFVNPARDVKPPKLQQSKPKALSPRDLEAASLRAEERKDEKNSFIRLRNEALFLFLVDTGLRADEVRLLKRGHIDDDLSWIKNVRTKGRRFRNVYITSAMQPKLREYLDERRKQLLRYFAKLTRTNDENLPLFISTYNAVPGKPESFAMGSKTIWRAIHEISPRMKLHPHLLRHSYATELLNHSNDIRLVSQALGHSDVRITMRYTERTDEHLSSALEASRGARKTTERRPKGKTKVRAHSANTKKVARKERPRTSRRPRSKS